MDYSKYKYELKKKKNQAKKNQKVIVLKEIHLTIRIGEEDYKVKLRQCAEFIKKQYKVKVLVKLKGRELGNIPEAMGFLDRIYKDLGGEEVVKMDKTPQKESTGVACIICANVK
jgi:translation initiation factor IF-3